MNIYKVYCFSTSAEYYFSGRPLFKNLLTIGKKEGLDEYFEYISKVKYKNNKKIDDTNFRELFEITKVKLIQN